MHTNHHPTKLASSSNKVQRNEPFEMSSPLPPSGDTRTYHNEPFGDDDTDAHVLVPFSCQATGNENTCTVSGPIKVKQETPNRCAAPTAAPVCLDGYGAESLEVPMPPTSVADVLATAYLCRDIPYSCISSSSRVPSSLPSSSFPRFEVGIHYYDLTRGLLSRYGRYAMEGARTGESDTEDDLEPEEAAERALIQKQLREAAHRRQRQQQQQQQGEHSYHYNRRDSSNNKQYYEQEEDGEGEDDEDCDVSLLYPLIHRRFSVLHSAIVVYGHEYFFEGGIARGAKGKTRFGPDYRYMRLGYTRKTRAQFEEWLKWIEKIKYDLSMYRAITYNCHTFVNEAALYLMLEGSGGGQQQQQQQRQEKSSENKTAESFEEQINGNKDQKNSDPRDVDNNMNNSHRVNNSSVNKYQILKKLAFLYRNTRRIASSPLARMFIPLNTRLNMGTLYRVSVPFVKHNAERETATRRILRCMELTAVKYFPPRFLYLYGVEPLAAANSMMNFHECRRVQWEELMAREKIEISMVPPPPAEEKRGMNTEMEKDSKQMSSSGKDTKTNYEEAAENNNNNNNNVSAQRSGDHRSRGHRRESMPVIARRSSRFAAGRTYSSSLPGRTSSPPHLRADAPSSLSEGGCGVKADSSHSSYSPSSTSFTGPDIMRRLTCHKEALVELTILKVLRLLDLKKIAMINDVFGKKNRSIGSRSPSSTDRQQSLIGGYDESGYFSLFAHVKALTRFAKIVAKGIEQDLSDIRGDDPQKVAKLIGDLIRGTPLTELAMPPVRVPAAEPPTQCSNPNQKEERTRKNDQRARDKEGEEEEDGEEPNDSALGILLDALRLLVLHKAFAGVFVYEKRLNDSLLELAITGSYHVSLTHEAKLSYLRLLCNLSGSAQGGLWLIDGRRASYWVAVAGTAMMTATTTTMPMGTATTAAKNTTFFASAAEVLRAREEQQKKSVRGKEYQQQRDFTQKGAADHLLGGNALAELGASLLANMAVLFVTLTRGALSSDVDYNPDTHVVGRLITILLFHISNPSTSSSIVFKCLVALCHLCAQGNEISLYVTNHAFCFDIDDIIAVRCPPPPPSNPSAQCQQTNADAKEGGAHKKEDNGGTTTLLPPSSANTPCCSPVDPHYYDDDKRRRRGDPLSGDDDDDIVVEPLASSSSSSSSSLALSNGADAYVAAMFGISSEQHREAMRRKKREEKKERQKGVSRKRGEERQQQEKEQQHENNNEEMRSMLCLLSGFLVLAESGEGLALAAATTTCPPRCTKNHSPFFSSPSSSSSSASPLNPATTPPPAPTANSPQQTDTDMVLDDGRGEENKNTTVVSVTSPSSSPLFLSGASSPSGVVASPLLPIGSSLSTQSSRRTKKWGDEANASSCSSSSSSSLSSPETSSLSSISGTNINNTRPFMKQEESAEKEKEGSNKRDHTSTTPKSSSRPPRQHPSCRDDQQDDNDMEPDESGEMLRSTTASAVLRQAQASAMTTPSPASLYRNLMNSTQRATEVDERAPF